MPAAFIGVDVIAGTNGETDELFLESYQYLLDTDFSQLHVFPYSERPGTFALKIPHVVPVPERKERVQRYIDLSERKLRMFYESQLGTARKVLFEHQKKGTRMFGWTDNYVRIETKWDENLANGIVDFQLTSINQNGHVEGVVLG